jgi:DNA-binding LacI/PurR family transcriptional regulator
MKETILCLLDEEERRRVSMKQKRVTMEMIAAELGLSRLTISSVLNNRFKERKISPETAKRVLEHIARRGYAPSEQARMLKSGKNEAVGVIHTGHLNGHVLEAFNILADKLNDSGKKTEIMITPANNLLRGAMEVVSRGASHVVWIWGSAINMDRPFSQSPDFERAVNYLSNVKTIIYNFHFAIEPPATQAALLSRGFRLTGVNRIDAYHRLARFLRKQGHSRIGVVPSMNYFKFSSDRLERLGARIFLLGGGGVFPDESNPAEIAAAVRVSAERDKITVACLHDDEIAAFVIDELIKSGVRVPEDVSVIGFDGVRLCPALRVPLSTLKIPVYEMVSKVLELIDGKERRKSHCFGVEIVRRDSLKTLK